MGNYKYAVGSYVEYSLCGEQPRVARIVRCSLWVNRRAYVIQPTHIEIILESEIIRELTTGEQLIFRLAE